MLHSVIADEASSMPLGRRLTSELLARRDRPAAICYSNDDLAAGGVMHCIAEGIAVPREVALAGFNGLSFLEALRGRLADLPRLVQAARAPSALAATVSGLRP